MNKKPHLMMVGSRDTEYEYDGDFYATPTEAITALLSVETFDGNIWEPACGDGAISKILIENNYDVESTDLYNRGYGCSGINFLEQNEFQQTGYPNKADNIITNPPYRLALPFAEKALELSNKKVAFLLRLAWLEGQKRNELFASSPLSKVWVFSKRLPRMHKFGYNGPKTTSTIAFAWFIWDHEHKGKPELGWI